MNKPPKTSGPYLLWLLLVEKEPEPCLYKYFRSLADGKLCTTMQKPSLMALAWCGAPQVAGAESGQCGWWGVEVSASSHSESPLG